MATAQVILRDTFPAEQLGTSQAIYALGAVLGPSIGPTLGGILTDNLSWPWVFDVNIVPGILAFVLLLIFLRESPAKKIPVDVVGIVLLTVGIFSLQYVLDQGQREDWFSSQAICIATLTALGGLGAFTCWELTFERPIVDLRLLKTRAVAGASLIAAANAAGIFGVLLLLPQFSIEQLGFTSTLAGILIGLRAIPIALLTIPLGRLANSHWVDLRLMVGAGLAIQAAGTFWLSRIIGTDLTIGVIAPTLIVMGIGISLIFTPVLVAALRSVKPHDAPKAASFVTLSSQLGGSVFAALLVTIFERRAALHLDHLAAVVTPNSTVVQDFMRTHPLTELSAIVAGQAETIAYQDVFWVISIILAASVPLVLMIGRKKQSA
jgi:DHA2 family multidrug resistance protein